MKLIYSAGNARYRLVSQMKIMVLQHNSYSILKSINVFHYDINSQGIWCLKYPVVISTISIRNSNLIGPGLRTLLRSKSDSICMIRVVRPRMSDRIPVPSVTEMTGHEASIQGQTQLLGLFRMFQHLSPSMYHHGGESRRIYLPGN